MKQQRFIKTFLASVLIVTSGVAFSAPYEVVDLGKLGGNYSIAYDISDSGIAVGTANGALKEDDSREFYAHAVKFQQTGNQDLGVLIDGTVSEALGINTLGVAVGYANVIEEIELDTGDIISEVKNFAVIFDTVIESLPEETNLSQAKAYAINDDNIIVGHGLYDVDPQDDNGPVDRAFIYNRNNQTYFMVPSLVDDPIRQSYLTDISNTGMALGFSDANIPDSTQFTVQSFMVNTNDNNAIIEIPTVDNQATFAFGINIHEEVVGDVYISGLYGSYEAFYYDTKSGSGELTFLGFLRDDFTDSRARDINDNGQIVGRALVSAPTLEEYAAFIYENDEMKNLNELIACDSGWKLTEATSINNAGQIVGFGVKDGEVRAFRLDPTGGSVETCAADTKKSGGGSIPLLTLGLLGLLALRRKLK